MKEVRRFGSSDMNEVNKLLSDEVSSNWVLLKVDVVERQFWVNDRKRASGGYLKKTFDTVYVLGRVE